MIRGTSSVGGEFRGARNSLSPEGCNFRFIIVAVGMGIFLCWVCANFVKVLPPTVAVFKLGMVKYSQIDRVIDYTTVTSGPSPQCSVV